MSAPPAGLSKELEDFLIAIREDAALMERLNILCAMPAGQRMIEIESMLFNSRTEESMKRALRALENDAVATAVRNYLRSSQGARRW